MVEWTDEISGLAREINSCQYLYLRGISEPRDNQLQLLIEEAEAGEEGTVQLPDLALRARRIESVKASRAFTIVWDNYIAYSVTNESYAGNDDTEIFVGKLFRTYSKSHFLDYVARATIASQDYPGPFQHAAVICLNHVIDVVSTMPPTVARW